MSNMTNIPAVHLNDKQTQNNNNNNIQPTNSKTEMLQTKIITNSFNLLIPYLRIFNFYEMTRAFSLLT